MNALPRAVHMPFDASPAVEERPSLLSIFLLGRDVTCPTPASRSMTKRLVDITGALFGLILAAIPMLIVAALVKLDSRGPALFRQRRLGMNGRPFWVLKFRTMTTDAEQKLESLEALNESDGVLFKIRRDPRITKIGSLLRRTSLDELPQLFNILRGDMSLVGPRPLQIRDCDRLRAADPAGYNRRLSVPPGLTGMWQVGGRSEVDSTGMMRLDLEYVERWSLALDLRILIQTVGVVIARRGAC